MKVLASESKEKHFDDHDEVKALGSAEKHCNDDHDEVKVFASESGEKYSDDDDDVGEGICPWDGRKIPQWWKQCDNDHDKVKVSASESGEKHHDYDYDEVTPLKVEKRKTPQWWLWWGDASENGESWC